MTPRRAHLASWLALGLVAAGCGKKGPPLAPLRPVPAAVATIEAHRLGDTVRLDITVPDRNADGTRPADLRRLEVYGLTIDPAGGDPSLAEFLAEAALVATIDVRPPPPPASEEPAPPADPGAAPPDPRPAQGAVVRVEETVTEPAATPVLFDRPVRPAVVARTLAALEPEPGPRRTYLVVGYSRRDRRSAASTRVTVPLGPPPAPPDSVTVTYTEREFTAAWPPRPPDPWQPVWSLLGYRLGVDVYEISADAAVPAAPLNLTPVIADEFVLPLARFGEPRCFAVRTTETRGSETMAGPLSRPACVTPIDTFPPAAPTGLTAVSGGGVISLIWDASTEPDLGGYLVLRGEAPGETLRAVTASSIADRTYRDPDVRPGVRYVYAVVAIDQATPPNISAQSNRVEETAR